MVKSLHLVAILVVAILLLPAKVGRADNLADFLEKVESQGDPCTTFVVKALEQAGIATKDKIPDKSYTVQDAIHMNGKVFKASEMGKLVKDGDVRTKGVVHALTAIDKGSEVTDFTSLQRGDIVQYWYYRGETMEGHTAIVVGVEKNGRALLKGSQKGKVGTFTTSFTQTIKKYAVRPRL